MIMMTLKALEAQKFDQVDQLWVPTFRVDTDQSQVNEVEGLGLSSDNNVVNVRQKSTIEFFTQPASDGTPEYSPDYPTDANIEVIADSFVFVAVNSFLEESIEMPLFIVDIDRQKHWKRPS